MSFQRSCVVANCNSDQTTTDVSFHYFPANVALREKWIEFVGLSNVKTKACICCKHFTEDCFSNLQRKKLGFASKLRLKPDAVPSIKTPSNGQPEFLPSDIIYASARQTRDVGCQWEPQMTGRQTVAIQMSKSARTSFQSKDVPQFHVVKDEEERTFLDQERLEPQLIKEEKEEELCSSKEEEQLLLKQEIKTECDEILVIQFEDLPEKHICKEKIDAEQLLWKQERSSSLSEEKPELPPRSKRSRRSIASVKKENSLN